MMFLFLFRALLGLAAIIPLCHAQATFRNPLKEKDGSDPFMIYFDGNYYLLTTTWSNVQITQARTIGGLKTATSKVVWSDTDADRCCSMWAPELCQVDEKWWIYYTAGVSGNTRRQHLHVLEGGANPMDTYSFKSTIIGDRWAIDSTVAQLGDSWYIFFSAYSPNNLQSLFAAKLANPYTVEGNYSVISEPTLDWEQKGMPVNEGPAVLKNGSRTWMTYSASYCGTDGYSLGLLTLTGDDPLSMSSWTKNTAGPVFSNANNNFGPGHNGFFLSPDRSTTYNVYHASPSRNVKCNGSRRTFAQPVSWNSDGTPNFGEPRPVSEAIPVPPGDGCTTPAK